MDNLDLGIFNMKHNVFPRIKQFGEGMLRWMATMATDVGVAEPSFASASLRDPYTVSYSRKTCANNCCNQLYAIPINASMQSREWIVHIEPRLIRTLALSETSMSSFLEIYNQFIGSTVQHAIEFYSSHSLRAVYTWDMLTRVIHVFDPAGGTQGCTADQQERHELIAPRLHDGCFHDFYAGWPTPKKSWMTIFPRFLDTVSREESGICALHIIRYHDGDEDKDTNNQEHPNENKEICSSRRPETSRQPVIPACRCNIASHRCKRLVRRHPVMTGIM